MQKIKDYSLYLVITEEYGKGRSALEIAEAAIAGGVDIIQMREKDKPRKEIIRVAKELSALCRKNSVIFIVNDDPYIAKEADADGVHLGQGDIARFSLDKARGILGKERIAGISTHSIEQFKEADKKAFDYITFGPIFPTKAKDYCIGTEYIGNVLNIAKKPVFFIGGIDLSNIGEILKKGGKNAAVIRAILEADDITSAAKELKNRLKKDII